MRSNAITKAKLNNAYCRSFAGGADVDRVWDADLPGFALRARRKTSPEKWTWIYVYRHKATRQQVVITLGAFTQKTPDEARKAAKEAANKANTSDDLRDRRVATLEALADERKQPTMEALWTEYWRVEGSHKRSKKRIGGLWDSHLKKAFGRLKVRDIGPQDIERFKALYPGTPYNTNRALAVLSRVFTLAVKWGYRKGCAPEHPVRGVGRYPEPPRERYFTEKEIGRILRALEGLRSKAGALALLMLLETGARSGEVKHAHWDQFDFGEDRTIWTVESSNTKTARPIARVLSPEMTRRLQAWRPYSDGLRDPKAEKHWVFPNTRDPKRAMLTLAKPRSSTSISRQHAPNLRGH